MNKLFRTVMAAFALGLIFTTGAIASDYDELPAADVAAQGFDFYDKAVNYNDLKLKLGPIPNPGRKLQFGFICKAFENEFWRQIKDGSESAAKEMNDSGIEILIDARSAQGEADESGQLAIMSNMVNRRYDALLCSPISDGNLLPAVEKAMRNNIPMAVVNDAFMPQIPVTVGAHHWGSGEQAAAWLSGKISEGEVAIISGTPRNPAARSRTESMQKWFADNNPKITVVDVQNGDWDRMKAKDVSDILLKKYPNLKGIYCNNDTMAMGAIEAVKSAGKVGKCLVVGTDGTSEAYASIRAGELSATIDCFPYFMSQIAMEMLLRKIGGQDIPKVIYSPMKAIDSSNAYADPKELIDWTGFSFE